MGPPSVFKLIIIYPWKTSQAPILTGSRNFVWVEGGPLCSSLLPPAATDCPAQQHLFCPLLVHELLAVPSREKAHWFLSKNKLLELPRLSGKWRWSWGSRQNHAVFSAAETQGWASCGGAFSLSFSEEFLQTLSYFSWFFPLAPCSSKTIDMSPL